MQAVFSHDQSAQWQPDDSIWKLGAAQFILLEEKRREDREVQGLGTFVMVPLQWSVMALLGLVRQPYPTAPDLCRIRFPSHLTNCTPSTLHERRPNRRCL